MQEVLAASLHVKQDLLWILVRLWCNHRLRQNRRGVLEECCSAHSSFSMKQSLRLQEKLISWTVPWSRLCTERTKHFDVRHRVSWNAVEVEQLIVNGIKEKPGSEDQTSPYIFLLSYTWSVCSLNQFCQKVGLKLPNSLAYLNIYVVGTEDAASIDKITPFSTSWKR